MIRAGTCRPLLRWALVATFFPAAQLQQAMQQAGRVPAAAGGAPTMGTSAAGGGPGGAPGGGGPSSSPRFKVGDEVVICSTTVDDPDFRLAMMGLTCAGDHACVVAENTDGGYELTLHQGTAMSVGPSEALEKARELRLGCALHCFDGILNLDEDRLDCGGEQCQHCPIQVGDELRMPQNAAQVCVVEVHSGDRSNAELYCEGGSFTTSSACSDTNCCEWEDGEWEDGECWSTVNGGPCPGATGWYDSGYEVDAMEGCANARTRTHASIDAKADRKTHNPTHMHNCTCRARAHTAPLSMWFHCCRPGWRAPSDWLFQWRCTDPPGSIWFVIRPLKLTVAITACLRSTPPFATWSLSAQARGSTTAPAPTA